MVIEKSHVLPSVEPLLVLSHTERIRHIHKDFWIGYPRAIDAIFKLRDLFEHPTRQRMPNLLIIGPTNNGKSMIVEKFYREHPCKTINYKQERMQYSKGSAEKETIDITRTEEVPVLIMQMPSSPEVRRFYINMCYQLNMSYGRELYSTALLEVEILSMIKKFKTRMLIIDEIHNILGGRADKQREFLNLLRFLGNNLRISIVCLGTRDAYMAIRSDPQLENRFEPFPLPTWQASFEYESLLASMVKALPLRQISHLNDPEISHYILQKSEGILGEIVSLTKQAAIHTIRVGREYIDMRSLQNIHYKSPSERRAEFERIL